MCAAEHDTILSWTAMFWEQTCTYLVEILPLTLTTEFCASLMDNRWITALLLVLLGLGPSMAIKFSTGTMLDLSISLVLADSWQVCLPNLLE